MSPQENTKLDHAAQDRECVIERERERERKDGKGYTSCSAWKRFRQRFFALLIGQVQSSVREVASGGPPLICPITGPS